MQQPPTASAGASSTLRSDAQQLTSKAADRLHSEVDARKGSAATQVKSVSNAVQTAAGQLDEGAPAWLKSAFQQGAEQIQRFADTLEQKDSREILNEVQTFARERPAMFLGACAAAGFAAARLLKAGSEQQGGSQSGDQYGASHGFEQNEPWAETGEGIGTQTRALKVDSPASDGDSMSGTSGGSPASTRGEFV